MGWFTSSKGTEVSFDDEGFTAKKGDVEVKYTTPKSRGEDTKTETTVDVKSKGSKG